MIEAVRKGGLAPAIRGLLVLVFLCIPAAGTASAQDEFLVERVSVDVTAANAVAAREQALDEAYAKALDILVERLGASRPRGINPADLSQSIEIADERVTAVRYSANVTVQFDQRRVNSALGRGGSGYGGGFSGGGVGEQPASGGPAPPPMPVGTPILVLPVYEWSGSRILWETSNPWYQAWSRAEPKILTGQAALPPGSGADRDLTVDQALAGDRSAILRLARDRGAENAVVVLGRYAVDFAAGQPSFDIVAAGYGPQLDGRRANLQVPGDPNSFVDDLAAKAVAATVARIDETWRPGMPVAAPAEGDRMVRPTGPERDVIMTVPLQGPADLARTRGAIAGLPMVTQDQVVSLSRGRVVLRVRYAGDTDMLRIALRDAGYSVTSGSDGWLVSPSGAAPGQTLNQMPRPLTGR